MVSFIFEKKIYQVTFQSGMIKIQSGMVKQMYNYRSNYK
jgi:hypothetical protein